MNSKIFRFAFKDYFPELLGDTRELSKIFFENVAVKEVDSDTNEILDILVNKIYELKKLGHDTFLLEQKIELELCQLYALSTDELALLSSTPVVSGDTLFKTSDLSSLVSS